MLNLFPVARGSTAWALTDRQTFEPSAGASTSVLALELKTRSLPCALGSERVFLALYGDSDYAFWLDSSLQTGDVSRYSIMGDASGPHCHVVTADVAQGTVSVRQGLELTTHVGSVLDFISRELRLRRMEEHGVPGPFALGYVGYLGYELKAECGGKLRHRSDYPDAGLIFADRALIFDHAQATVHLLCLSEATGISEAEAWLDRTEQRLKSLAHEPANSIEDALLFREPLRARLRDSRQAYLEKIHACQEAIAEGESYEVCLTTQIHGEGKLNPLSTYRRLRRQNPAPFASFLRLGDLAVLSSSPERFLALGRDRTLETRPIKGTAPRSADPKHDARLAAELAENEKTRAENLMIVDLCRNDLGRCAEIGSVTVNKLFDVESYATVHQLVSTVRARLRPELTAIDAVRACFPGGSMTGAPKLRTMEIIDDLEPAARGIYSGALGYFSLCGAMDLSMVIRTMILRPNTFSIGTGGAIVALSEPDNELAEMLLKAKSILNLLQISADEL